KFHIVHQEQFFILFHQSIFRFCQYFNKSFFIQRLKARYYRQTADKFRNQTVIQQVFWKNFRKQFSHFQIFVFILISETDHFFAESSLDNLVDSIKRPSDNEKDISRIDLDKFLMRMLSPALRWYASDS